MMCFSTLLEIFALECYKHYIYRFGIVLVGFVLDVSQSDMLHGHPRLCACRGSSRAQLHASLLQSGTNGSSHEHSRTQSPLQSSW